MTLSENMKGAVFMMVSMAAFVVNDALMKSLSGHLPLFQAIFLRGLFATALIAALAWRAGVARLSALAPADRKIAVVRVAAEIGVTSCFLQALFSIPIANATAILQSTPLALTLAAALFMGERVGWRRWAAVAAGFLGVMLIVRPGTEGFESPALYALAAVGFVVIRDLATRRLSPETPSLFVTLMTAVAITIMGGVVTTTQDWTPVAAESWAVMAASAVFLLGGYYGSVLAMRHGEISFVSPFRYTILLWALALGWVVFSERPDWITALGAMVVAAAGLFTFFRERARAA